MHIKVSGSGYFIVEDGKITEKSGAAFSAKLEKDTLTLSLLSEFNVSGGIGNTMVQSGNSGSIQIGGMNITISGKTLTVNGSVEKVIVNGKELLSTSSGTAAPGVDEYIEYPFTDVITQVSIGGSGGFVLNGNKCNIDSRISLFVIGSGSIEYSLSQASPIVATIVGSGEIEMIDIHAEVIAASVTGSGEINAVNSSFRTVGQSIVGSGEISGI